MHLIIIRELNITNRGYKAQKKYYQLKDLNKLVSDMIQIKVCYAGIALTSFIVSSRIL